MESEYFPGVQRLHDDAPAMREETKGAAPGSVFANSSPHAHCDPHTDIYTQDAQSPRQGERETRRNKATQTHGHKDIQTHRDTDTQTHRHTDTHAHVHLPLDAHVQLAINA